jgi:beta-lactamase superfamily II metal-dependent hydrolase
MKVWFLNVGHGDCTVIEHPSGRVTMVDINNSQDYDPRSRQELITELAVTQGILGAYAAVENAERRELDCPVTFFKDTFGNRSLFRFILTHPDLDHMRGLKALFDAVSVANFWDTANTKPTPSFRSQGDREDWTFYQKLRSGSVPGVSVRNFTSGASHWAFNKNDDGSTGGDGIYVVSPSEALLQNCNARGVSNDLSITLWITYAGTKILLPGDAEAAAWDSMIGEYNLKATVLKASHHGRDSGYHLKALQNIDPQYVVISVGRKPDTDAHKKYAYHCANVYSTRRYGRLTLTVGLDGSCHWTADRNGA